MAIHMIIQFSSNAQYSGAASWMPGRASGMQSWNCCWNPQPLSLGDPA